MAASSTIMTTIRAKKTARSVDPITAGAVSIIIVPNVAQVTYHASATTTATMTPTGIVRRRRRVDGPTTSASATVQVGAERI